MKAMGQGSVEENRKLWATARQEAYWEAARLWNELDASKRDRIEVPSPPFGATTSASSSLSGAASSGALQLSDAPGH